MKEIIETLYPMNRCLLGEGYDSAIEYIKHLVDLEVIEIPSGTKFGSWTVPDEWIVRDAWIKDPKGTKIADYKKEPMRLVVGSAPIDTIITLDELRKHWHYSDDLPDAIPYEFSYYQGEKSYWGFCFPKNEIRKPTAEIDPSIPVLKDGGITLKTQDKLKKGKYHVLVDTEFAPGKMKIGVHTIKGKTDREILLFAHLDHPFQANDNLSGVACLLDLASKIQKEYYDHTIKIVFCPETIGSVAYAYTQDLSKVDFMIAVEICGNDGQLLLQLPHDRDNRLSKVSHLALQGIGKSFKKGLFRNTIGSDEYVFNDPLINIPGIMLSRHPYKEYHTADDTPSVINYDMITETGDVVLKIIEIWERDYKPKRVFKGPLMRSRYDIQTKDKHTNLSWD